MLGAHRAGETQEAASSLSWRTERWAVLSTSAWVVKTISQGYGVQRKYKYDSTAEAVGHSSGYIFRSLPASTMVGRGGFHQTSVVMKHLANLGFIINTENIPRTVLWTRSHLQLVCQSSFDTLSRWVRSHQNWSTDLVSKLWHTEPQSSLRQVLRQSFLFFYFLQEFWSCTWGGFASLKPTGFRSCMTPSGCRETWLCHPNR